MRPDYTTTWRIEDWREVSRYDVGGHTHFKLDYHFVWRTKFNKTMLGPTLSPFLVEEILTISSNKHVKVLGVAVAANHVHLCARLRPVHAPAKVMGWIKSTTSLNVMKEFPQIKERFGIRNFWGRGYHVETLGEKNPYAILSYLGKQDEKHNLKSLDEYFASIETFLTTIPDNEDSDDEDDE
jgi:putative transposase